MSGEPVGRYLTPPPPDHRHASAEAAERSRRARWSAKGAARVIHPSRGTIVVPCGSPYAALLCAAEVWGCDWLDIRDAKVWRAEPGDQVAARPYII
ncbi:hypothetical protein ACQRBP_04320 [Eubacteriales bacterium SGI.150]